jgi:uroporphyrinogen-III synthase
MAAGRIDAIALTNLGQIRRLIEIARARGCEDRLRKGLEQTPIASHGLRTDIYPAEDAFFMRPLISAMAASLDKNPPRAASSS